MKNKGLKILLAASLALNLAFVSTALYKKFTPHEKSGGKEMTFDRDFKLDPRQKEEIQKIIKKFKIDLLEYKQDILDKRIAIIEAMSDTEFNMTAIENKTAELNRLENRLNLLFVDTLIKINSLLEPEQRLTFLYQLSENWFFIDRSRRPGRGHR